MNMLDPGIYLNSVDGIRFSVLLSDGETSPVQFPPRTPAELLLAAASIDYTDYRKEIRRLYEEHPLFKPKLDIPVAELEDLVGEALMLPSMLSERDPFNFSLLGHELDQCLQMQDDGTASFLLRAGQEILRTLEMPVLAQIRLRNIFEMAFDGAEVTSPSSQFEKLRKVYPDIAQACIPPDDVPLNQVPLTLGTSSPYGLLLLELILYFHQDEQRITRCEHCWEYFIPKTKKVTRYCDRIIDGQSCKQRGANLMRHEKQEQSQVDLIYRRLRDCMYSRMTRYEDASPEQKDRLIQFDSLQYAEWSNLASRARLDYANGKITAAEFLQKIDTMHDLDNYDVDTSAPPPKRSQWQKLVARDPDFDPERHFPPVMFHLDLAEKNPHWELRTAQQLQRNAQKGHMSLRAKYSNDESQG